MTQPREPETPEQPTHAELVDRWCDRTGASDAVRTWLHEHPDTLEGLLLREGAVAPERRLWHPLLGADRTFAEDDVAGLTDALYDELQRFVYRPAPFAQALHDSSARLVDRVAEQTEHTLERLLDDERVPRCPRCLERVTGVQNDDSVDSRADAGAWVVQLTRLTTLQPCGHVLRPAS